MLFVLNWLLEGNLFSNPISPFFGGVSKEGVNLLSPPTSRVKKKLIKFPIQQVEFGFTASSCEAIHPNALHPTLKRHGWSCILGVCFNFSKGKILQAPGRFGESIHEHGVKLN